MASPSDHETTDATFSALIEGHGDIVGRQILRLSEGAFATFTRLCRATRDAVPRAEVAASLPSHLDAALRRNDEPAARRLAGEAMERVRRNCLTLTERLRAMEYPCEEASSDHPRSLGYMVPRTHDSSDAAVQRDLDALTAKLEAFRDEGRIDQAQLEDLKAECTRRVTERSAAIQLLDSTDPDRRLPLMLTEFLMRVGRVSFMDPDGYKHVTWWEARHPEVLAAEAPLVYDRDMMAALLNRDKPIFSGFGMTNQFFGGPDWHADPLVVDVSLPSPSMIAWTREEDERERMRRSVWVAPDFYHKDNQSGGPPYQIDTLGADAPLDPVVHDGGDYLCPEFTESLARGEDPLDAIRDSGRFAAKLAATWLGENPELDMDVSRSLKDVTDRDLLREEGGCFAMKLNNYLVCLVKWMKIKPGPRDRGPLTLLGYLRHAILEMGGFPGFHGNAAFEPLRRELVEGLEPF